jgi:hypothetical protein
MVHPEVFTNPISAKKAVPGIPDAALKVLGVIPPYLIA